MRSITAISSPYFSIKSFRDITGEIKFKPSSVIISMWMWFILMLCYRVLLGKSLPPTSPLVSMGVQGLQHQGGLQPVTLALQKHIIELVPFELVSTWNTT
jgi:hypothetical protein